MKYFQLLRALTTASVLSSVTCREVDSQALYDSSLGHTQESVGSRILSEVENVIGGSKAPADEYPWFVLADGCGGTLVSSQFILSAAHCYEAFNARVTIGKLCNDNYNCGQYSEARALEEKFIHPNYDVESSSYDFLLVKLREPSTVPHVPFMDMDGVSIKYGNGVPLSTLGFGMVEKEPIVFPDHLMHAQVGYVPQKACKTLYTDYNTIDNSMMCASTPGIDSCQGDSGGPLYDAGLEMLVGVVSWGNGCAKPGYPGVYSRISTAWDWIQQTICENSAPGHQPPYCMGYTVAPTKTPLSCSSDEVLFELDVVTGYYGKDVYWEIRDVNSNEIVQSVKGYSPEENYHTDLCLPKKCYEFTFRSANHYGDDDHSYYSDDSSDGNGYHLSIDGQLIGGDFSIIGSETVSFGCNGINSCGSDKMYVTIDFIFDNWADEISWEIRNKQNGKLVFSEDSYNLDQPRAHHQYCLPKNKCYQFIIYDDYGDGIQDNGSYMFAVDGEVLTSGSTDFLKEVTDFGCGIKLECGPNQKSAILDLSVGSFGRDVWWKLIEYPSLKVLYGGGGYTSHSNHEYRFCVPDTCAKFSIYDEFGDGLTGGGEYILSVDGDIIAGGSSYGYGESTNIGCQGGSQCKENETYVELDIALNECASKVFWTLVNSSTSKVVQSGGLYNQFSSHYYEFCIPESCHIFNIEDSSGNINGGGEYTLKVDGVTVNENNMIGISSATKIGCDVPDIVCKDDEYKFTLYLEFTSYAYETSWVLLDESGEAIYQGYQYPNDSSHTINHCVPKKCHTFVIKDQYGDGMEYGSYYILYLDGEEIASGGSDFTVREETEFGCLEQSCNQNELAVNLVLDMTNYANEISWEIEDVKDGKVVEKGEEMFNYQTYSYEFCLPKKCHRFTLFDDYGDGMSINSSCILTVNNEEILNISDGKDFFSESAYFGCEETKSPPTPAPTSASSKFRVISLKESNSKWCLKKASWGSVLVVERCKGNQKELWEADDMDLIHMSTRPNQCIRWANKLKIKECPKQNYKNYPSSQFVYNPSTQIFSMKDDVSYAFTVTDGPLVNGKEVTIAKVDNAKIENQKWMIEWR